jgi:cell division septal protein FtsQ
MTAVAAPADRRFRRAHVKPSRRRRGWRGVLRPMAMWAVLVGTVAYGAVRLVDLIASGRILRIDRITVRGNTRLSRAEVMALLDGLRGQSLLGADLDEWQQRLLTSTWVREAALRRSLPSTIDVVLKEREPIGIARLKDDMYLIDEQAGIIDRFGPQYEALDLPIIDGLLAPAVEGPVVEEGRALVTSRLLSELAGSPTVGRRVSQINVTDVHNATVILNGDPAVIELGDRTFVERLESYLEITSALHERVADIDYVDMRFDNRVYVRPAGKTASTMRRP